MLQLACVCLAPSQYHAALQSKEKRSSRVKIFETGEKEQKHSLGSLSKKQQINKRQRGNVKRWMICYTVYKPTSNICRSSVPLSLREDVSPWVRLQRSFSPQPLLFCLQMPSNNSDKNSLPSLTKNKSLIFSKFCQALFRVRSDLAVIPQLSADLPAVPSLPAPKGRQKCWVSMGIQPALQSRLPGCAP